MTDGQWVITNFTSNGTDLTSDFSSYKFQYFDNYTVNAIKNGVEHPPYFNYHRPDIDGVKAVQPVTQYESKSGLTYLVGKGAGGRIDIFAFPQSIDPWTAPPLQKASVPIPSGSPALYPSPIPWMNSMRAQACHCPRGNRSMARKCQSLTKRCWYTRTT